MADPTSGAQTEIRRATRDDRDRVLVTVVEAFRHDPAFRFFFPDDADYDRQAAVFAGHLFDKRVGHDSVWLAGQGEAVALWSPPEVEEAPEFPTAVHAGLGADAIERLTAYESAVYDALPLDPHWYLGVLATHPKHVGRALGRRVMAEGLRAAGEAGVPGVLETTNPDNVRLYEGAGWKVASSLSLPDLDVWVLRHDG